jgi:hypothetical protein
MAGYNGRTQSNATTTNAQIQRQREAYQARNENTNSARGVARENLLALFPGFEADTIIEKSFDKFLTKVEASSNPDFSSEVETNLFKSNNKIIGDATAARDDYAVDKPSVGSGPNLKSLDIDSVILGNTAAEENVTSNLPGGRGFGVSDPSDKGLTMGNYLKKRYSIDDNDAELKVIKGERSSADEDPYDYDQ